MKCQASSILRRYQLLKFTVLNFSFAASVVALVLPLTISFVERLIVYCVPIVVSFIGFFSFCCTPNPGNPNILYMLYKTFQVSIIAGLTYQYPMSRLYPQLTFIYLLALSDNFTVFIHCLRLAFASVVGIFGEHGTRSLVVIAVCNLDAVVEIVWSVLCAKAAVQASSKEAKKYDSTATTLLANNKIDMVEGTQVVDAEKQIKKPFTRTSQKQNSLFSLPALSKELNSNRSPKLKAKSVHQDMPPHTDVEIEEAIQNKTDINHGSFLAIPIQTKKSESILHPTTANLKKKNSEAMFPSRPMNESAFGTFFI